MIVTYRYRRQRPTKPAQAAEIRVPRIVQQTPPRRREWKPLADDAEADARVAAFFARMVRPHQSGNFAEIGETAISGEDGSILAARYGCVQGLYGLKKLWMCVGQRASQTPLFNIR